MTERKKIRATHQLTVVWDSIWPDHWGNISYEDAIAEEEDMTSGEVIDRAFRGIGEIVVHDAEIKVEEIDDE